MFYEKLRALIEEYVTAAEEDVDEVSGNGRYYGAAFALYPSAMEIATAEEKEANDPAQ